MLAPTTLLSAILLAVALGQSVLAQGVHHEPLTPVVNELTFPRPTWGYGPSLVNNIGDVDGDAVADLALGFSGSDRPMLMVVSGRSVQPIRTIPWPAEGDSLTATDLYAVEGIGDIDHDGVPDIAVGAYSNANWRVLVSRVYFVSGRTGEVLRRLTAPQPENFDYFGFDITLLDDLNGDGNQDIGIGSMYGGMAGRAYVYDGRTLEIIYTWEAPDSVPGEGFGGRFGEEISDIGDLNGDGVREVAVGASYDREFRGTVSVYNGATGNLYYRIESPSVDGSGGFGTSISILGDLDGDGVEDVAVGEPYAYNSRNTGRVHIFSGRGGHFMRTILPPPYGIEINAGGHYFGGHVETVGAPLGERTHALLITASGAGFIWVINAATGEIIDAMRSPNLLERGQFGWSAAAEGWIATLAVVEDVSRLFVYKYGEDPPWPFRIDFVFPNPTRGDVTVRVSLPQAGPYELSVLDMMGRSVRTERANGLVGMNDLPLSLAGLPPAAYVLAIDVAGTRAAKTMTVVR